MGLHILLIMNIIKKLCVWCNNNEASQFILTLPEYKLIPLTYIICVR